MRWLLFLSRLAFICGVFFLLSVSLLIKNWTQDEEITSTIIVIGYFMGILIVPFTNLCYLAVLLTRKKLKEIVPLWLVAVNILFLLVLIYYLIYVNDQPHT
jgi:hypothetical protein